MSTAPSEGDRVSFIFARIAASLKQLSIMTNGRSKKDPDLFFTQLAFNFLRQFRYWSTSQFNMQQDSWELLYSYWDMDVGQMA
ncbi:hypothetical protein HDU93_006200, partial [Gonapodya sp. JEL0774]